MTSKLLRNSCPYTIYPTFSSPLIEHPISPSMNSLLHRTDIKIRPHSSPTFCSLRRDPVPILDASSCFTFLVLIRFALPPVLRSAGLHLVPRMLSSLGSRSCSTFATQHRLPVPLPLSTSYDSLVLFIDWFSDVVAYPEPYLEL